MPATEQFDERMQDYVFNVPSMVGGTSRNALTFQLDPDYPFISFDLYLLDIILQVYDIGG